MRAFTLFFASALCGLIVPVLHGQSVEPPRPVSMRVLSFEGIVTDLAVRTPDGLTRILARANAFSPEITALSSGGGVDFYRDAPSSENSSKGGTGNAQRAPVARIAVQPGVNRYLVIVVARGSSDDRVYSAYSIPDADGALPVGSARVVNFTDAPLAVQLGNNSAIVRTAESSVLACPSDSGGAR